MNKVTQRFTTGTLAFIAVFVCLAVWYPHVLWAQDEERVQRLSGVITGAGDFTVYRLPNLAAGERLTAHMRATSGNLDPLLMLLPGDIDLVQAVADYQREVDQLVVANGDVSADVVALRTAFSLAWDDDGGSGYAAALDYQVTESGEYILLASGALGSLGRNTAGEYELLLGINSPAVLEGIAPPVTEDVIAVVDNGVLPQPTTVQEVVDTLNAAQPVATFTLKPMPADTTVYAYVESTAGGFRPVVFLRDFGGKPLEAGNLNQADETAKLEFYLDEGGTNYVIEVQGASVDEAAGDQPFRLLVGLNAPEVLTGTAEVQGGPIIEEPIVVQTGMRLNRISGVDSKDESFTMLGSLRMDWVDPAYAFSPDECDCTVKVYTGEDFRNFLADFDSRWPSFAIYNQLGPRFSQNNTIAVWSDGRARYVEEFTATIQADFDFRQFPFDTETFPVFMDMLFSEDYYVQEVLPGYSAISSDHGEDEFIITDFTTTISTETGGSTGSPISRFTFAFTAPRHLDYYIFQIFVPILLIALISWFTFFLRDYTRRIEAAAGNVLLFIAFSFSLSDNYPRLGYLTFLDAIMLVTFVINTAVILYNVYLKQLESGGQVEKAEKIDRYLDWVYPVSYLAAIGIVVWIYFGRA